jgi:hypothetical protein
VQDERNFSAVEWPDMALILHYATASLTPLMRHRLTGDRGALR